MPEAVELPVRGGERRGMFVAERDDRDAGGEVEIAPAEVVGQPDAVAVDERDARRRIRREQCILEHDAHATTAVAPISATRPLRAARAAASTFGTIPPSNEPASTSLSARAAVIDCMSSPWWKTPGT